MSLELVRESIKVNQVVGENTAQTIVENDIIVPDVKPDVARILILDGDVYVNKADTLQDKVQIDGVIRYKILYISDGEEQAVKSINPSANFTYSMDVPNSRQGMKCRVKSDVEHIEYEILHGRKVNVKAIIKFDAKVQDEFDHYVVSDIRGAEDIQILKNKYRIKNYIGRAEEEFVIKDEMEVPAGKPSIKEILRNDVKISGIDYKITENKVIAKGDLNVFTLYVADDEQQSIQFIENEMPFSQFIDLEAVNEEAIGDIEFRITDSVFEPDEDSDGELRVLKGEVGLKVVFDAYSRKNVDAIEDAFCPHYRLSLDKESAKMEEPVDEVKEQIIVKDTLVIDDDSPNMAEVYNVLCKPVLSEYAVENNKVVIEGLVRNNVLYLADNSEQPVFCHEQEIPFSHAIDVKVPDSAEIREVELDIEHCNYSMISPKEIEVRFVIGATAKAAMQVDVPIIKDVAESALDDKRLSSRPSIVIYFAQPGDNLWKIAKRYYTTLEDIRKVNNLSEHDNIIPGQQIIIPRRD
ncbi:MAG TPA: DUF3794 domain-containing protein [Clostridiaceae bacterium]|nr:DUF3794 domain-containing protein [Clostridiaceae bacterium]